MRARASTFVLGAACSRFYDFGRNKMEKIKNHALTDELRNHRTRVIHALAGGARGHEQKCGFLKCLLCQKAWRGGLKKRILSAASHRWKKALRTYLLFISTSPQEFVNKPDAGATGYFMAISKHL
jgi:hypothetical protein